MLKGKELKTAEALLREAVFTFYASQSTRNSLARRKALRHRFYKAVGGLNKLVREMERTPRDDSRNDLKPSFPRVNRCAGGCGEPVDGPDRACLTCVLSGLI